MGRGRVDRACDHASSDERPRRIVNEDDVGGRGGAREGVGHRVLPAHATGDNRQRLAGDAGPSRGRGVEMIRRHRHHDLVNAIARGQRVDAEIKNGAPAELKKLLGAIGAKPDPSPTGGNDGSYVHGAPDCTSVVGHCSGTVVG